jgi:hypothetical protein
VVAWLMQGFMSLAGVIRLVWTSGCREEDGDSCLDPSRGGDHELPGMG